MRVDRSHTPVPGHKDGFEDEANPGLKGKAPARNPLPEAVTSKPSLSCPLTPYIGNSLWIHPAIACGLIRIREDRPPESIFQPYVRISTNAIRQHHTGNNIDTRTLVEVLQNEPTGSFAPFLALYGILSTSRCFHYGMDYSAPSNGYRTLGQVAYLLGPTALPSEVTSLSNRFPENTEQLELFGIISTNTAFVLFIDTRPSGSQCNSPLLSDPTRLSPALIPHKALKRSTPDADESEEPRTRRRLSDHSDSPLDREPPPSPQPCESTTASNPFQQLRARIENVVVPDALREASFRSSGTTEAVSASLERFMVLAQLLESLGLPDPLGMPWNLETLLQVEGLRETLGDVLSALGWSHITAVRHRLRYSRSQLLARMSWPFSGKNPLMLDLPNSVADILLGMSPLRDVLHAWHANVSLWRAWDEGRRPNRMSADGAERAAAKTSATALVSWVNQNNGLLSPFLDHVD